MLLCAWGNARAQVAVPAGAGSYASFPPQSENTDDWNNDGLGDLYQFVYDRPIYVANNRRRSPIPTNDWWTDLIVSGKNCGMLWAYPLSVDPDVNGTKIFFANSFNAEGTNLNNGGYMQVKSEGYTVTKSFAKDWSDWGLTMSMWDSVNNKNIDVTMAHGVPYMWFETKGLSPEFSFGSGAAYLNAAGTGITMPANNSFVVQTDGRYFGVHLPGNTTAEIQGQQFVKIDLGSVQNLSKLKLNWENAYGKGYFFAVSNDDVTYNTVATVTNGDGGIDSLMFNTSGRYVKLGLTERGTIFAFSLYEMRVYNGATLLSQGKPVTVSSTQSPWAFTNVNDGNLNSRWASDGSQVERLVLNTNGTDSYFVVSALPNPAALTSYETYAFNKVTGTKVSWNYDILQGKVSSTWNISTKNLKGLPSGSTMQGFLPHLYLGAANNVNFSANSYLSPRGTMKTAIGSSFTFTYDFTGIVPSFNAPYSNTANAHPYKANPMFDMLTKFSKKTDYGSDTYWGGKDLVNFAKFTLMAKELNHQAYPTLKAKAREALVNWLTYTPGETDKFFARYDRWGACVGFNESYGSASFTDNHFHYGYLITAAAMYGTIDPEFITQYGPMLKIVAKQYANYDRADTTLPFMRTFDPWIGHSYAGGTGSAGGNNQESTSESMQAWIGLFLLGDIMGDADMRAAGAFGYSSESNATLEYWFDWRERNLPPAYAHNMVGILSNSGFAYGTFFSGSPLHIHAIQYLPVNPGFKYLARDSTWAAREYADMMRECAAVDNRQSELDFGDDWAHVALGFRQLFDPGYVAAFMETNLALPTSDPRYIMDYDVAGMTYYYTHARQNLGKYSFQYRTDFPTSSVFENAAGGFGYAVAYNPATTEKVCHVFNTAGSVVASFTVPARTLLTYPSLPTTPLPTGCYGLSPTGASASSGNASLAIDGNTGSRWESSFADPQSITIDLGVPATVNRINISWENANAKNYTLSGSLNGTTWTQFAAKTNMPAGPRTDIIDTLNRIFRYIKLNGTVRNTQWGYSIYEFEVCGRALEVPQGIETQLGNAPETEIYPVPASSFVNISSQKPADYTLSDMQGRVLHQGRLNAGNNNIDIRGMAAGVYIARIGNSVHKLVVEEGK